jgi:CHASE2 domain-containing sensor protein
VGMGISIGLLFLHGHPWLEEKEDAAVDWVMQLQWGTAPTKSAVPFAVLDIDEPTYRSWGEPFHTPRDRLLKLIDYAVRGGAALVVVDVDLSQRGHDPAADAGLRDYLAHYGGPRARPILLVRTFREPLSQEAVSGAPNRPEDVPLPDVRRSFLEEDPDIARSPLIHWGSSLFAPDTDGTLRRWRLWHPACADGASTMVPSLQLLTVALVCPSGKQPEQVIADVHSALRPLAPKPCDEKTSSASHGRMIEVCELSLSAEAKGLAQRILYTLPWKLKEGEGYPEVGKNGTRVPLLTVRSAQPITDGEKPVDASWLEGRVVVIGGSFEEGRDWYFTPLGRMPGYLVLVNAIRSLQQFGEIGPAPWYVRLSVEAVLIVGMSLMFAWLSSFWGMLVSGVLIIFLLLPLSFWFFKQGVWLDFAIPLIAVQLHQMAAECEERGGSHASEE